MLGQVVAQDVFGVYLAHGVFPFVVGAGFFLQAGFVALQPFVCHASVCKQVPHWGVAVAVQVGDATEEAGVVHPVFVQHAEGVHDQGHVCIVGFFQPELGLHVVLEALVVGGFIAAEAFAHGVFFHDRQQGVGQVMAVGEADLGLAVVGVAAFVVGMVADEAGVEVVQEGVGAVVEGVADDGHVVAVHHSMAEADGLPVGNQPGGAFHHFGEPAGVALWLRQLYQVREVQ